MNDLDAIKAEIIELLAKPVAYVERLEKAVTKHANVADFVAGVTTAITDARAAFARFEAALAALEGAPAAPTVEQPMVHP